MNQVYGVLSIGGFMATMLCYVIAGIEVTKMDLILSFMVWIGIELLIWGTRKLLQLFSQQKKRAGVDTPAQIHG